MNFVNIWGVDIPGLPLYKLLIDTYFIRHSDTFLHKSELKGPAHLK